MKRKLILPMLAVLLAVAGAFSKPLFAQMGWYDSNGAAVNGGVFGTITTPVGDTPQCLSSGTHTCIIRVGLVNNNAYDTKANAEAGGSTGLLKYN